MSAFPTFSLRSYAQIFALAAMVFILSACSPSAEEMQFNGSNISGSNLGADLTMVDGEGNLRTLESFSGKVVVVFLVLPSVLTFAPPRSASWRQLWSSSEMMPIRSKCY